MGEPKPDILFRVAGLNVFYGPMQAVFDAHFEIPDHSIVTLLGANGAGKTTILRALAGLITDQSGEVILSGKSLGRSGPEQRVRRGMALVADNRLLFPTLTVDENLRAGGHRLSRSEVKRQVAMAYHYFPALAERRSQRAGALSGGQAQMLAIGRALVTKPRLLLLDEPSQGLAPKIIADLFHLISQLAKETGTTVLLVEQNATMALDLASYGYILAGGRIRLEGATQELKTQDAIRQLYLGG